ncbi:MAG: cell division protein ZapA [Bacteroidales bacterium]|nr:cell division protein ZapA [Bacteroidales bacterium]MDD4670860.1 cell division protein ZapA [Bacteroidales bacterium]
MNEEINKQKISIQVADRRYQMSIEPASEGKLRLAVERINNKITDILNSYDHRDVQDALSVILIHLEMDLIALENREEVNDILQKLQSLDEQLGDYLVSR